jgi:hypothetical protein
MTYEISAVRQKPDFSSVNAAPLGGCIGTVIESTARPVGLTQVTDWNRA